MDEGLLTPRVEREDDRVYFIDADGGKWRIHDLEYGTRAGGPGRKRSHAPPGPATCGYRAFVRADRLERWHQFRPDDDRTLSPGTLARQLSGAGYVSRAKFEPGTHHPR